MAVKISMNGEIMQHAFTSVFTEMNVYQLARKEMVSI